VLLDFQFAAGKVNLVFGKLTPTDRNGRETIKEYVGELYLCIWRGYKPATGIMIWQLHSVVISQCKQGSHTSLPGVWVYYALWLCYGPTRLGSTVAKANIPNAQAIFQIIPSMADLPNHGYLKLAGDLAPNSNCRALTGCLCRESCSCNEISCAP
jgi:hypothetical protein